MKTYSIWTRVLSLGLLTMVVGLVFAAGSAGAAEKTGHCHGLSGQYDG